MVLSFGWYFSRQGMGVFHFGFLFLLLLLLLFSPSIWFRITKFSSFVDFLIFTSFFPHYFLLQILSGSGIFHVMLCVYYTCVFVCVSSDLQSSFFFNEILTNWTKKYIFLQVFFQKKSWINFKCLFPKEIEKKDSKKSEKIRKQKKNKKSNS